MPEAALSASAASACRMNVQQAALSLHARMSTLPSVRGAALSLGAATASSGRFLFAPRSRAGMPAVREAAAASPWRPAAAGAPVAIWIAAEVAEVSNGDAAGLLEACLAARRASAAFRLALFTIRPDFAVSDPSRPSATDGSGDNRYGVDAGDSLSEGAQGASAESARRGAGAGKSLQLDEPHCD